MIPEEKNVYSDLDVKRIKIKRFALANFDYLKRYDAEYMASLSTLAQGPIGNPADYETASQYVNAVFNQIGLE